MQKREFSELGEWKHLELKMEKANGTQTTKLSTTTQAIFASSWDTSASREQAISRCSKLPRPLARIRRNWASNFRENPTQIQNKG